MSKHADNPTMLAGWLASQVRRGHLTLAQVVGLTADEIAAFADLATRFQRAGRLTEAADLLGLLLVFDPYEAGHWRTMAAMQRRLGNPGYAALCLEVVTGLAGADEDCARAQATCLQQIGALELVEYTAGGAS